VFEIKIVSFLGAKMTRNKNQSNLTVFGEETSFSGVLEYTDNLVITGNFEGTIKSTGNLEIAKTAVCNVDSMSANEILIAGSVKGNIYADSKLEMSSGGKIEGDITTKKLRIADNVDFKGKVSMLDKPANVDIFSVTAAEYKEAVLGKTESDEKSDNPEDDAESSDEE
jgi:cytoskeletal protein CcmA (bactofilin family)